MARLTAQQIYETIWGSTAYIVTSLEASDDYGEISRMQPVNDSNGPGYAIRIETPNRAPRLGIDCRVDPGYYLNVQRR